MRSCRTAWGLTIVAALATVSRVHAQDDRFAPISQRMEEFIAAGEITGAVTLVGEQGQVVHLGAVGQADIEKQTPMTGDRLFGIMSMTKPITATALMILVDEGKLSIDDPVEKFIPAFAGAKLSSGEPVHGLTVRRLLTHTSGLVGDQHCPESLAATAEMLAARPFGFQPGKKWEYSPGLNVVGRIIEIVSGQPYEEFVAERILQPLGMNDTTFHPTSEHRKRLTVIYALRQDKEEHALVPAHRWISDGSPEVVPSPSGGLFSTAGDMFRFYQMILDGGVWEGRRIASAEAVAAMTHIQTGDLETGFTPGNGWGLGWCVVREPQDVTGMLSPGTFGHGGAYGTEGWVDPVKQRIFVLMYQRTDAGNTDGAEMRKEFQRLAVEGMGE